MIPMSGKRSYSGKFLVRVGPPLHQRLSDEARALRLSLNEHCVRRLSGTAVAERLAGVGVDAAFIDRLVGAFPATPLAVVLFGSVARGEAGTASDVDLLVVFDAEATITRSLYRRFDAAVDLSEFPHPPNPHLVSLPGATANCGGLWFEVALDGLVVWERGTAVSAFLRALRDRISSGALRRRTVYGHPYWVRQEQGE